MDIKQRKRSWYWLKKNEPEWLEEHRRKSLEYYRKVSDEAKKTPESWRAYVAKQAKRNGDYRAKVKVTVLMHYGGKCVCCGEKNLEFLTIDHIGGGGRAHRKSLGAQTNFYKYLINNNYPRDKFRLLCMNCNWAIRYGDICPHKKHLTKRTGVQY